MERKELENIRMHFCGEISQCWPIFFKVYKILRLCLEVLKFETDRKAFSLFILCELLYFVVL